MSKRILDYPESSGSSETSKNKRKKLDEERTLPLKKFSFTRKCKVSTLLKEPYKIYRQLFRTTAEEFTILRRDAMHFVTFLVLNWAASGYNLANFPDITKPILWTHCYRMMAVDTNNLNSRIKPAPLLTQSLIWFNIVRIDPNTKENLYDVPNLDDLHIAFATSYTTAMIQNLIVHLSRNVNYILKKVFRGFYLDYKHEKNHKKINEDKLTSLAIDGITHNKSTDDIVNYIIEKGEKVDNAVIELFNNVQKIYTECFTLNNNILSYDDLCDYDKIKKK